MTRFKTRFGSFSADGKEYVVSSPRTPRPWINVISNGDYGMTISQAGSGYSWRTHAQLNRITRWEQDLIRDEWGKFIYLRDEKGNIWSAGWKPVCVEPDSYACRHGFGYSAIESSNFGIATDLTVFVTPEDPMEVWILTIRNKGRRPRKIDVFTYFEWGLGQSPDWHREFHKSFISTEFDPSLRSVIVKKSLWEVPTERGHWNTDWPYTGFHSSSLNPVSFGTEKEDFLGMYGSLRNPEAVRKGRLRRRSGRGLDAVANLHNRVSIGAGDEQTVIFTLGAADSPAQARDLILKYRDADAAQSALKAIEKKWDALLGTMTVETPDASMNLLENSWLKYQTISGRMWGRTAYYQTGGAFGFRDQLQDSQLWLLIDPRKTLDQIRLHARHQFKDGTVYHWWHPITERGLHTKISDNLLWLPFVLNNYLRETNDLAALDLQEPWVDSSSPASLFDHCRAAIESALRKRSPRGIPLIGGGDWNDGLSAVGLDMKGESVWLGQFLHMILAQFGEICERRGDPAQAARYKAEAGELRSTLNREAWDGRWYFGATKDSGEKLGSRENAEGTIWLNPQTWSVIADVADAERASTVMDVIEQELEFDIGPLLIKPAYKTADKEIGYLTRYAPGMRENGGVYTHGATWAVIAAARLGRGETAFRIYSKLNPIRRGMDPLRYAVEPYVTPGNIEGPESAFFGRGGWTWYTGSSAWLFRVGLEWILGIRPAWDGLVVDPCIPAQWKGFRVRRNFRGTVYSISVSNPDGVQCGVKEMIVNGAVHCRSKGPREKTVPVMAGGPVDVQVVLGA